ncbi:MAG: lipopolysaccharide kinase InaA family protein [Halopseudomonas sp.]
MIQEYFAPQGARELLAQHGLDNFAALWALQLDAVDAPNTSRGGWSSVYRLDFLDARGVSRGFYLKRQDNHLTRSLRHPLGEPTFAREFRAIQEYASQGIPALQSVYFAQRRLEDHQQALLLTEALDGYEPLSTWFEAWDGLDWRSKQQLILAAAKLVRSLHQAGKVHQCLYPKHVFIKADRQGVDARLIDLEKTRRAWFGQADYIADLGSFSRRSRVPSRTERLRFILAYMEKSHLDGEAKALIVRIQERIAAKERR